MFLKSSRFLSLFALFTFAVGLMPAQAAGTLSVVKKRGYVSCGVSQGLPGFSNPDDTGRWTGIDVDLCRAVAAAVFGPGRKYVKFTALSAKERFTALSPVCLICWLEMKSMLAALFFLMFSM